MDVPAVTADQMREVDRIMVDDLGIDLVRMMENAGRALADLVMRRHQPRTALLLCGTGGNGGGGLVAARHLANRGVQSRVVLTRAVERFGGVPAEQLRILQRMGVVVAAEPHPADVVVDAVIGYSLAGAPTGRAAELIRWANAQPAPVVSLDAPSGLDVTSGESADPCVRASATLTLALPKVGLAHATTVTGDLYLADISVPPSVYARLGLAASSPFADDVVVRLSVSRSGFRTDTTARRHPPAAG